MKPERIQFWQGVESTFEWLRNALERFQNYLDAILGPGDGS